MVSSRSMSTLLWKVSYNASRLAITATRDGAVPVNDKHVIEASTLLRLLVLLLLLLLLRFAAGAARGATCFHCTA